MKVKVKTHDAIQSAPPALVDMNIEPYNHYKQQEIARKNSAYWLVGLVASITIFPLVYLWSLPLEVSGNKEYVANLILILQIIFGPIITLAETAIGYYFGKEKTRVKSCITTSKNACTALQSQIYLESESFIQTSKRRTKRNRR